MATATKRLRLETATRRNFEKDLKKERKALECARRGTESLMRSLGQAQTDRDQARSDLEGERRLHAVTRDELSSVEQTLRRANTLMDEVRGLIAHVRVTNTNRAAVTVANSLANSITNYNVAPVQPPAQAPAALGLNFPYCVQ